MHSSLAPLRVPSLSQLSVILTMMRLGFFIFNVYTLLGSYAEGCIVA